jgi:hypothetical protein
MIPIELIGVQLAQDLPAKALRKKAECFPHHPDHPAAEPL